MRDAADAMPSAPWYRQRWPWLLMLGPAIVIVACAVTVWLAVRSDDGLVADDYYKRGLAINTQIERGALAAALDLRASVDLAAGGYVRVRLSSASADAAAQPATLRVVLAHPTRAVDDARATLARGADGSYAGRLPPIEPGRRQLIVETDAWRLPAVPVDGPVDALAVAARAP